MSLACFFFLLIRNCQHLKPRPSYAAAVFFICLTASFSFLAAAILGHNPGINVGIHDVNDQVHKADEERQWTSTQALITDSPGC